MRNRKKKIESKIKRVAKRKEENKTKKQTKGACIHALRGRVVDSM